MYKQKWIKFHNGGGPLENAPTKRRIYSGLRPILKQPRDRARYGRLTQCELCTVTPLAGPQRLGLALLARLVPTDLPAASPCEHNSHAPSGRLPPWARRRS